MTSPLLTYCGNVHSANDLESWLHALREYSLPVAQSQRSQGRRFGLGTWWNADLAEQLSQDPSARAQVQEFLAANDLSIWTLNVFPQRDFHNQAIKTKVYQPDWASEERLLYTRHAATAMALLGSDLDIVPLSTLPLGYEPADPRVMARNLVRAASHLHAMEQEHGLHMVLALEPEPFCLLETVAATIEFLNRWVFAEGAWTVEEAVLRRHLGVCVDLCHLAVVREDAVTAIQQLRQHGIQCAKIQVSSCLELRQPQDPAAMDQLLAFDESVYLHQCVADTGLRALDLSEVRQRRQEFSQAKQLRSHFHLPVFWDQPGALGSSQAELLRVLAALPRPLPLLEVETYTWGILPQFQSSPEELIQGLVQELDFVWSAQDDSDPRP